MDSINSILIPILDRQSMPQSDHTFRNALIIALWLNVKLHFVISKDKLPTFRRRFSHISEIFDFCIFHESSEDFIQDIANTLQQNQISLLILGTDQNSFLSMNHRFTWEQEIIQKIEIPILITPINQRLSRIPFGSLLVPFSGETGGNSALDYSLHFSDTYKIPIDLIHVTPRQETQSYDFSPLGLMSDHFYHEYPYVIDRLISSSSPFINMKGRLSIREFWHCCGDQSLEILKRTQEKQKSLLVLEWKGISEFGHAKTLKTILRQYSYPILLVRQPPKPMSRLKVGRNFNAA